MTVDAAALAIKSANCVILRGGSDSINSAIMLGQIMRHGLRDAGLPEDTVQVIADVDRAWLAPCFVPRAVLMLLFPEAAGHW